MSSIASRNELRPLSDESVGTCDWGYCDKPEYAERLDDSGLWLTVCRQHAGKVGLVGTGDTQ
jgi:hypothetical protein